MSFVLLTFLIVLVANVVWGRAAQAQSDDRVASVLRQLGTSVEARILSLATTDLPTSDIDFDILIGVAKRMNVNIIFIEVLADDGYVIYPSKVWPHKEQGRDRLQTLIERAHAAGIQVVPWIKTFFATATGELGPVLSNHPEWAAVGSDGSYFTSYNFAWFNPAHPKARAFIRQAILELVTEYDIDGLQLDYIRYPNSAYPTLYSYDEYSRTQFKAETGIDPVTLRIPSWQQLTGAGARLEAFDPGWQLWTLWRERQVTSFVAELVAAVREVRRDLPIFFGVIPALWTGSTYPYARFYQNQHWAEWVQAGYADGLTPPSYTDDLSVLRREVGNVRSIAEEHSVFGPVLVYPSLMVYPDPQILLSEIQLLREMEIPGLRLFSYGRMNLSHFRALWEGPFAEPALVPHARPFASALRLVQEIDAALSDLVVLETVSAELADGLRGDLAPLAARLEEIAQRYVTEGSAHFTNRLAGITDEEAGALQEAAARAAKAADARLSAAGDQRLRDAVLRNLRYAERLIAYGIMIERR